MEVTLVEIKLESWKFQPVQYLSSAVEGKDTTPENDFNITMETCSEKLEAEAFSHAQYLR